MLQLFTYSPNKTKLVPNINTWPKESLLWPYFKPMFRIPILSSHVNTLRTKEKK